MLGIRSRTQLTAEVLRHAPRLSAIGCFCIGTNQADLGAAMRLGIPVFNAPFSIMRSVAELVLAQIIMLLRGITARNAILHRGGWVNWVKSAAHSYGVRGKTLGIVGHGHIGTQIGVLAEQLGMRVAFRDTEARLPLGNARESIRRAARWWTSMHRRRHWKAVTCTAQQSTSSRLSRKATIGPSPRH